MCITYNIYKIRPNVPHPCVFAVGARWDTQSGTIGEAGFRVLTLMIPVIQTGNKHTCECAVYSTKMRGPGYIWTFR